MFVLLCIFLLWYLISHAPGGKRHNYPCECHSELYRKDMLKIWQVPCTFTNTLPFQNQNTVIMNLLQLGSSIRYGGNTYSDLLFLKELREDRMFYDVDRKTSLILLKHLSFSLRGAIKTWGCLVDRQNTCWVYIWWCLLV